MSNAGAICKHYTQTEDKLSLKDLSPDLTLVNNFLISELNSYEITLLNTIYLEII